MNTKLIFALVLAMSFTACKQGSDQKPPQDSAATVETKPDKIAKGSINGIVKDKQGKPLEDVVIVIANTTAHGPIKEISPMTNAKGEFSFTGLPEGEYTLRATPLGYQPKEMKVTVEANKTASVEFIMTK
jgi:hypothetical protein